MESKHATAANPLDGVDLGALRALRLAFSRGRLPPAEQRTPDDDARIAAFFALRQLLLALEAFGAARAEGEPVRLVLTETGRSPAHLVMRLAIVKKEPAGGEAPAR